MFALCLSSINYSFWSATFFGAKCVRSHATFLLQHKGYFLFTINLYEAEQLKDGGTSLSENVIIEFIKLNLHKTGIHLASKII